MDITLYVIVVMLFLKQTVSTDKNSGLSKCNIKQPMRGILDLKQPVNPANLLNETSAFSLRSCSEICCNTINCNAYIWRNSAQCFLFFCKIEKDCRVVPYQGTVTGFVSKEPVSQESGQYIGEAISNQQVTKNRVQNDDIASDEHDEMTQADDKSEINEPSNIMQPLMRGELNKGNIAVMAKKEDNNLKRTSKGLNLTSTVITPKNVIATNSTKRKGTTKSKTTQNIPVLNSSLASQKVSHTTTTSLIAALTFGSVFFAAVAFLIGKPWWQQFCTGRDGYNRVTFLMNGT